MNSEGKQELTKRWGRILENSFDEIYVFDAETWRFLQVSKGALQNLGYSLAQMKMMTAVDIKPEISTAEFSDLITPLQDGKKELLVFETRHRRKDGSLYPVEVRLQWVDEKPRPVIIAIILDITERQAAESEIRKREQLFQSIAKVSPVGIFRTDSLGNCIYTNEHWLQMAGMDQAQALGEGWVNAVHPEDRESVIQLWYSTAAKQLPFRCEFRFLRPDGKVTWLLAQAQAELDHGGQTIGYVGCVTDISKLKQTQKALKKSTYEWNYAMDYFEDAIALIDLDDRVIRANKTFYRFTGLSPDKVIGRSPVEIFHPEGSHANCAVCKARKAKQDARIVLEADDPENLSQRPIEKTIRVIRDQNGDPQSLLVATHDLTHQRIIENELRNHRDHLEDEVAKRTRQLELSNKELESFSYSIAHDLRAPLRAITSFSQIVMEDAGERLSSDEVRNLQRVVDAGKNMTEIIDDILELSRVSRVHIGHENVNISDLAKNCIRQLQDMQPKENVEVSIEPGLSAQGDQKLLKIMLNNLLGNAWKYTGKTEVSHITFGAKKRKNETIYFVKDNGVGFDMQYSHKLFGVFQRLHKVGEFEGTGIGLATVQRIIDRHGGKVWAESEPDKGATFYFELP